MVDDAPVVRKMNAGVCMRAIRAMHMKEDNHSNQAPAQKVKKDTPYTVV